MDISDDGDTYITTLKRSRKVFLWEYLCSFFLLGLLVFTIFKPINIPPILKNIMLGTAVFSFLSAEISRQMLRYIITNSKLIVIEGLIKQLKTNVYFHPLGFVPDINVRQNRIQRILNYGTIFVKGGSQNSFELLDIDRPHEIMQLIEDLVEHSKQRQASRGNKIGGPVRQHHHR